MYSVTATHRQQFAQQDLVAPGRRLHKEGDIMYHKSAKATGESRHVFVLSDMIVLTTKKGSDKYEFKMSVNLDDCKLIVMADSPRTLRVLATCLRYRWFLLRY